MSSETIISEVDEELRRDRIRKLWRQVGPWVLVGAIAVVIVVAGYEGWTWWQKSQAAKSSDLFYSATKIADGSDLDAAKKALDEVIAQGSGGYPMLAQFREAALLAQQGKTDDAVAAYDTLSSSLPSTHLRELALVLASNLLIDKGDVAAVQQRLGGSLTPQSPLRNAAREVLGLTQYKANALDDAMKTFNDIMVDPGAASDVRNRIQIYESQLVAEGAKPIVTASDAPASAASEATSSSAAETSAPAANTASASTAVVPAVPSIASAASAEATSASAAPSTAVDASTALDVVPAIDDKTLSLATPAIPADAATASVPAADSAAALVPTLASDVSSSAP